MSAADNAADNAVENYVQTHVLPQHHAVVTALRALMRECAPKATESFAYNMPVWIGKRIFAYMNGNQKGITFSFVYGTQLSDPRGLLKGSAKTARFVRLKSVDEIDACEDALRDYVRQALAIDAQPAD
jgi:hypothetical protein